MRFLIDNSLSPRMGEGLRQAGHDAVHVRELGLTSAEDEEIFSVAAAQEGVLVAQDTDVGTLPATRREVHPSVILFRRRAKSTESLLAALLANLHRVTDDLEEGSIVVVEDARLRVRGLPTMGDDA